MAQYDLRAAERARERLQGSEISGRPVSWRRLVSKRQLLRMRPSCSFQIDVHYSLPRDDSKGGDKSQVSSKPTSRQMIELNTLSAVATTTRNVTSDAAKLCLGAGYR